MAILTLREHLYVDYPGDALPLLQQLATFERVGRLRPGQHRVVRYWRLTNNGTRLILPRGLIGKVQKLLPGATVRDERLLVRSVDMGFHAGLRDYQEAMRDALVARGGGVMVMPPGGGKTRTALAVVDQWQQPALFFVHQLRLLNKTLSDARKLYRLPRGGLGAIADGRSQIGSHFTVATIQTLAKKPRLIKQLIPRVGTVVVDECVVGATLVDGIPIRNLKVGDRVWAYDETRSEWAQKPVTHVFQRPAPNALIAIETGSQRLICTPNHPILTRSGWKRADALTTDDIVLIEGGHYEAEKELRRLRRDHGSSEYRNPLPDVQEYVQPSGDRAMVSTQPRSVCMVPGSVCARNSLATNGLAYGASGVLLQGVWQGLREQQQFDHDGRNQPQVCVGTHDEAQSNAPCRCAGAGECVLASHRTQATRAGRQWEADARGAAVALGSVGLADRSSGQDTDATGIRIPTGLQNRHRESGFTDRARGGRLLSHRDSTARTRQQEDRVAEWARVDHLAVYERGRDAEFERVCPDGHVYNLEVADFHTFVANGIVTHNCHHVSAASYSKVLSAFPARYVLGLSATPARDDGLEPMVYALLGTPIRVSREALADKGVMIDPTIYMVNTHWEAPEGVPFHEAEEERATNDRRNMLIVKLVAMARSRGLRVLVLVEREIHATLLAQFLTKAGVTANPVFGRLPQPLQDRHFHAMEQGKAVVVATKLANEGLDWPALDCLVLATPGRSPTVLEQRTGRIARTAEGKTFALVYDLVDDSPMYLDQTRARIAKYQEMGYRIKRFRWPTKPDATVPS